MSAASPITTALLLMGLLVDASFAADGPAAETPSPPIDQAVVVKSQRTLTLLSKGKVVLSYKVALGGGPKGPSRSRVTTRPRKGGMFSTAGTRRAVSTSRSTFRTPTNRTGNERCSAE